MTWSGEALSRWTITLVFHSTTCAAVLSSRRRSVSNCATRQDGCFGISRRSDHISQYAPVCSIRRNWLTGPRWHVGVVCVLVTGGNHQHSEAQNIGHGVDDTLWCARVRDAGRETVGDTQAGFDLA